MQDLKILKPEDFFSSVQGYVMRGVPHLDAIVQSADDHGIEVETAAELVKKNPRIKSAIQIEGEELRLLPKTNRLPV